MRDITEHRVNPANDLIQVYAQDEPQLMTGAHHEYVVQLPDNGDTPGVSMLIEFQNGPINEVGVNGVTHEVLLAIVADRLRSFQDGPYACRENALALTKIEEAMHWLHHRTRARMVRGVEGTHIV